MNRANRTWPPLIVAERVPRLMRWRDRLLTSIMWGSFAALLESQLDLFKGDPLEWLGIGASAASAGWDSYVELLLPYLVTAALFATAIVIFSLRTLKRARLSLLLPQPAPLEAADEARRAGLNEAALVAARGRRIVIVHIEADGTHRIDAPHGL
jgi:hypothetical protein